MNEFEEPGKTLKSTEHDRTIDPLDENQVQSPHLASGLRERVRKLLSGAGQRGQATKPESAKDRTRSFTLLVGGIVGAVLLFIGVFSTPITPPNRETSSRAAPNLGRSVADDQTTGPRSSVTPLLNADVRSDEASFDQLSPADIRDTSSRLSESETDDTLSTSSVVDPDPLAAYRVDCGTGARTYSYGGPPVAAAETNLLRNSGDSGLAWMGSDTRFAATSSTKSSIVFVRTRDSTQAAAPTQIRTAAIEEVSLFPPGSRLVARLESAATTAVKTPVVASIEYNYERDGMIVVPAGSSAIGDVQQTSPDGYLSIRFHTLRTPDGREEGIEGAAIALDHKPLKGSVSGKNTGKKILSRTLSGVGTIAAYVVGAGGTGLSRSITGETLLRDRLASNIALAGEQELMNAAYSQNISVTVPANTRFYVVLQKAASGLTAPSRATQPANSAVEIPTVRELRELMELRQEIQRMYQEANRNPQ